MAKDSQSFYPICLPGQLGHAESLEFTLPQNLARKTVGQVLATTEAFVVNWHGEYRAYLNSCPHTRVSLNWGPNQFLDPEFQFIQCTMHGAIFEPLTGLCLRGPCLGQSLLALPIVRVEDGSVCVDLVALRDMEINRV